MVHSRRRLCYPLIHQECLECKKEWKKRSSSANITFRPKGIAASTDANLVIESDLDSDDEKLYVTMEQRESTSLFAYQTNW